MLRAVQIPVGLTVSLLCNQASQPILQSPDAALDRFILLQQAVRVDVCLPRYIMVFWTADGQYVSWRQDHRGIDEAMALLHLLEQFLGVICLDGTPEGKLQIEPELCEFYGYSTHSATLKQPETVALAA